MASITTHKRVVGFDVDETLGYFSMLTQFEHLVKLAFPRDNSGFIRLFAQQICESELTGKTRFFRPGTKELVETLSKLVLENRIECVFLLSNNPSMFMLSLIAEVLNFYAGFDLIESDHIFGSGHPLRKSSRDAKNAHVIRTCLGMPHLWAEHIMFIDDLVQGCMFDGSYFIQVAKYEYYNPVSGIAGIFIETLKTLGIKTETLPYLESIDSLTSEIMVGWPTELADYMKRECALADGEYVAGVNYEHLTDCVFRAVVIPAIEKWVVV